jgi:hypothetical protein
VVQAVGLTIDVLGQCDFWKIRGVVGSSESSALVAVASFWIWHIFVLLRLFLLSVESVLAKTWIELHQLKSIRRISLVLGSGVIALSVFGTNDTDNFADFALLCHVNPRSKIVLCQPRSRRDRQPLNYDLHR